MFRILFFTLIAALSTITYAKTAEYPMHIRCSDPANQDGAKIEIGLNIIDNEALFNFIPSPLSSSVVVIGVGRPFGFYSSSSVTFESSFNDRTYDRQKIVISAHANKATRVMDYAQFSLTMTKTNDGVLAVKELRYERGNDAFPGSNIGETLTNLALTCTIDVSQR